MGQVDVPPSGDISLWGPTAAQRPQKVFWTSSVEETKEKKHNSALASTPRVSLWLPPQEGQIQPILPTPKPK